MYLSRIARSAGHNNVITIWKIEDKLQRIRRVLQQLKKQKELLNNSNCVYGRKSKTKRQGRQKERLSITNKINPYLMLNQRFLIILFGVWKHSPLRHLQQKKFTGVLRCYRTMQYTRFVHGKRDKCLVLLIFHKLSIDKPYILIAQKHTCSLISWSWQLGVPVKPQHPCGKVWLEW